MQSMKKKLAIALASVTALIGGLIVSWKLPAYSGTIQPLTPTQQSLASSLRGHIKKLSSDIGARSLTKNPGGLERAAVYTEEIFAAAGYKPSRQTFSVSGYFNDGLWGATHATQSAHNIVVEIPGIGGEPDKASEIIIIGAHYDAVQDCPGANDNGSGVAAMLEIAKALAKEKFARTVRFVAFTNEEPPFFRSNDMGSYRYAESCKERGDNIVAMLSLETIGYYSDKPDSQRFPVAALALLYPKTGNYLTFIGNLDSKALLTKCATTFIDASKFPTQTLAAPADLSGVDFSDQLSFWRCGYPGIMVTDTAPYRYPHYHTNQDTADKINYDCLARVTDGLVKVAKDLANNGP
jgi:Zn-dependent M28 family amino/carboxypeptidase